MKKWFSQMCINMRFHGPRVSRRLKLLILRKWADEGIIIAGPYVGELGYELGEWMPHLKGLAETFKCRLHVFARKGREALYPFADKVHTFDFPGANVYCNWLNSPSQEELDLHDALENKVRSYAAQSEFRNKYRIVEMCGPSRIFKVFRHKVGVLLEPSVDLREKWSRILPGTTKVVLTCRACTRGQERNSNIDTLQRIAEHIVGRGWTPITVGKFDPEYPIPDIEGVNLINQTSLADLIAIYGLSSAVVGSSTGIMHLAAACGTPHLTWGSTHSCDRVVRRYGKDWNLNNTWMRFVSKEWDVSLRDIETPLEEAVCASSLQTGKSRH